MRRVLRLRPRRGAVLAFVAVSLPALLGVMALAIDLGLLYSARAEAQRAADSSALAGASAYMDYSVETAPAQARAAAFARAIEYAGDNYTGERMISTVETTGEVGDFYYTEEVTVQADLPNNTVRVWVRTAEHRTFFAQFLGFGNGTVEAMAAAHVSNTGTSPCVIPIYLPDAPDIDSLLVEILYYNAATTGYGTDNRNDYWSPDPPLASGPGPGGSPPPGPDRNYKFDFGRRIPLWPGSGSSGSTDMGWVQGETHESNYGFFKRELEDESGQSYISDAIRGNDCWDVSVGDTVWTTPGSRTAVLQDLQYLWDQDPWDTHWSHDNGGGVVSSAPGGNWRRSTRVLTVALVNPMYPPADGPHAPLVVTSFTSVLLEPLPWPPAEGVYPSVRVVPVAGTPDSCGAGGGGECSFNIKKLQLIQ